MVLGWYASNCSEALIGAALVRAFVPGPLRLDSCRNAGMFLLCGALAAPLASSFLDAALVKLIGWGEGEYWTLVRMRFSSNVLAELTVVPLILTWAASASARLRETPPRRYVEIAALFAGLLARQRDRLRPAAVRRQSGAGAVLCAAAVPAVGGGAPRRRRHRERARAAW